MRIAILLLLLSVGVPYTAMGQFTDRERITALESDMRSVRESLRRIEGKLDGLALKSAEESSVVPDLTLELLLILIVGGDKALYWRKRRNGTWTKRSNGEKV